MKTHSPETERDPHGAMPIHAGGASLARAKAAVILVHGRGGSAGNILELSASFNQSRFAYLAPQAASGTWYPYRFSAPIAHNEPRLSSALAALGRSLALATSAGIAHEQVILLGFSQGACLVLEYAARQARRYGGLVGLSGALIGPAGTPRNYPGTLDGTPVFLGCGDADPHIPLDSVRETAQVLGRMGGTITTRLYAGMGHTIVKDELAAIQTMMADLIEGSDAGK